MWIADRQVETAENVAQRLRSTGANAQAVALDIRDAAAFEAAIAENLYRLMEGKTVIAIAHRLSTIAALDRLVVMDKGRIVEQGTHAQLLAADGIYAQLWHRQVGGFLECTDAPQPEDNAAYMQP